MTRFGKRRKSRPKRTVRTRQRGLDKRVARQKKTLLSLAGIGASGFTDVSVAHDTYLHEKP
jgi:hypothetical protein